MTELVLSRGVPGKVLEIGTGSGYSAALLSCLAAEVFTVERVEPLARAAWRRLEQLGCENVQVSIGDGSVGWPEKAPFDGIVVAAGGPKVPDSLQQQLKIGGRLVIPVGTARNVQSLVRVSRIDESNFQSENLVDVRFVSLIGSEGWPDP